MSTSNSSFSSEASEGCPSSERHPSAPRPRALVLVGLMGAGKTTIGRVLARKLGWRFVDSDHEIERRTGVSIPTIFEIEGEAGFRDRETRILEELLDQPRIVLATGGGAILREENRRILRERGTVCYLKAHPQTLYHRTRNDRSRPLLRVDDPLAKLTELLSQRGPLYEATSDLTIEVERWTTKEIVEQLAGLPIFLS